MKHAEVQDSAGLREYDRHARDTQLSDADAHVVLLAATPLSVTNEFVADRVAVFDYAL